MKRRRARATFATVRLERRFKTLLAELSARLGSSMPFACQDWAATKAAYRFFANERIAEADILGGHFEATRARAQAAGGPLLVLHDTTEFSYQRQGIAGLGLLSQPWLGRGRGKKGAPRHFDGTWLFDACEPGADARRATLGFDCHQVLDAPAVQRLQRPQAQDQPHAGTGGRKGELSLAGESAAVESMARAARRLRAHRRSESDIYELFCAAREEGTHFLVRTCVDRLAEDGACTVVEAMESFAVRGTHRLHLKTKDGRPSEAVVEVRYRRLQVLPPVSKQRRYPPLNLTVIHAKEKGRPEGREAVDWKLLTDLPVRSLKAAVEKLGWYALRWKIEVFHKILKSGCKAEESLLRSVEKLVKLICVFCVVSWRIFWLTMLSRSDPQSSPGVALTEEECQILDHLVKPKQGANADQNTVSTYLTKVACLGGYLARRKDPPPGNKVMWRGICRLADLMLGAELGRKLWVIESTRSASIRGSHKCRRHRCYDIYASAG